MDRATRLQRKLKTAACLLIAGLAVEGSGFDDRVVARTSIRDQPRNDASIVELQVEKRDAIPTPFARKRI